MTSEEISLRVVDVLNEHGISYMLVGSLSTNFHSVPRATKDADIVIQTSVGDAARVVASSCPELRLDPQFGFESVTGTKKLVLKAEPEGFIVELFSWSDDPHDQERFRRRQEVEWENRRVWIATAEDAVITKLHGVTWQAEGRILSTPAPSLQRRAKCSTGLTSKAGATGTARGNFWSRFGRKCSVNRFYRKGA